MSSLQSLTSAQIQDIIERYQSGQTLIEIMEATGVTHAHSRYHLLANGVEMRSAGRTVDAERVTEVKALLDSGLKPHQVYERGYGPSSIAAALGGPRQYVVDTYIRKFTEMRPRTRTEIPEDVLNRIADNEASGSDSWYQIWYEECEKGSLGDINYIRFCKMASEEGFTSPTKKVKIERPDLRTIALFYKAHGTKASIARNFGASERTVTRWLENWEEELGKDWAEIVNDEDADEARHRAKRDEAVKDKLDRS